MVVTPDAQAWIQRIESWCESFQTAIDRWEDWLSTVEESYVTGQFEHLNASATAAGEIQVLLSEARQSRGLLLDEAKRQGYPAAHMTELARALGRSAAGTETRLKRLQHRLHRAQRMSTALWVTGFQAAEYTTALLDILATGNSNAATYGTREREMHEGGQIINAAA